MEDLLTWRNKQDLILQKVAEATELTRKDSAAVDAVFAAAWSYLAAGEKVISSANFEVRERAARKVTNLNW